MARLIQITCPGCKTTLKVNCGNRESVEVSCPKCNKLLAARVPASAVDAPVASPVAEIDPAFWNAPAPGPVATPARPTYATPPRPAPRPAMHAAQAKRGSGGGLKFALAVVGVLMLLPVGWILVVAVRALSQGGFDELASISLLPDTHEKVFAEFIDMHQRQMEKFLDAEQIDQAYVDDLRASVAAQQRQAERLLLRAVKLDAASREQHVAFAQRFKELNDHYQERARARTKSLTPGEQQLLNSAFTSENNKDAMLFGVAASAFITRGFFELPPPDGAREQVYFEEAEVVREYLKVLANVNSTRSLTAASEKIEALAQRMAEVAEQRAAMPSGLDFVNNEYEVADRAFDVTRDALLRRIERDFDANRSFEDARTYFASAREMVVRAAMGASVARIRTALAEARAARAQSPREPANGGSQSTAAAKPATPTAASTPTARVSVTRRAETANDKREPSAKTATPKFKQPPQFSVAPGTTVKASSPAEASAPAETSKSSSKNENDPPADNPDGIDVSSGNPAGPGGGFGQGGRFRSGDPLGPIPYGPGGRLGPTNGSADSRSGPRPAGPRFGPGPGFQGVGPMGPVGPDGFGYRETEFEERMKRFDGPTGVKIFVNTGDNASRSLKSITGKLGIREHAFHSSGGKSTIGIRFSGSLEEVEQAIDFGTVIRTDEAKREIHVDATK